MCTLQSFIIFLGKTKKSEGVGFKLPPESVLEVVSEKIVDSGGNMYIVPSFTDPDVIYYVDMDLGICECSVGKDGSPCKHQFITWKKHLKGTNFLPFLNPEERKQYSYLAIGKTLPDSYYEGLHDYVADDFQQERQQNPDWYSPFSYLVLLH